MPKSIRMEWRQGEDGSGSVYIFNPKPSISRPEQGFKQVEFNIPLADGIYIQDLGIEKRTINLRGTIVAKSKVFEDLEDLRKNLVNGIGKNPGQLHIYSITGVPNSKHLFYKGQLAPEGIIFDEQTNSNYLDYTIRIICPLPYEYNYNTYLQSQIITSNAKVV